ncbi:MAG: PKD domain-containing protein [Flavobacteriales bacterium]
MRSKIHAFFLVLFASVTGQIHAQGYPINGGDVSTCSGALLDSGGEGGPGYGNNENFTITICPLSPDSAISLNFIIFNLSAAGTIPTDELFIYDGSSTAEPLIGSWSGTDSPGIVSASFNNPTGCLTVQFISNAVGTGAFAAGISCAKPCEPPTASAVMSEAAPALICQGESLGFDGSASVGANGSPIGQYLWNFGDGILDSTSGPVVDHVFVGVPSQHIVHLTVSDTNGCINTNPVDLQVQISTVPTFNGFNNITHCAGEPVDLSAATSVTGTTWSSIPDANFGGGVELPDELGTPFSSTLNFSAFPPGATLTDISDLLTVCISMEHSYMGDFVLQLTSPSGTTVVFHQQGGGGTYLGIPNDNDEGNPQIGTCWEYCFSPTATNGTWVDNAGGGFGTSLPAGTYESLNPMSAFVGSPLNGTWTLTFTDFWGADNGFICSWSINFDPSILPPNTAYTPIPGIAHSDSSYWAGPALTIDPNNPLHYIANPLTVGPNIYTYTVTDNYGCTYDTTLSIIITPGVHVDPVTAPSIVCGQPILLQPGLELPLPTGTITYQWSPAAGLNNFQSPFPSANPAVPTWYTLNAYPAGHPLCGSLDSVFVNPLTTLANDSIITDKLCNGDGTGGIQVVTTGTGGPWSYTWSNSADSVVQSTATANGDNFQGPAGSYTVVITEGANGNGCVDSLTAVIGQPSPLLMDVAGTDTLICLTGSAPLTASFMGGTAPYIVHWDHGLPNGPMQTVTPLITTTYIVYATDSNNCVSDSAAITIGVSPPLVLQMTDTIDLCPKVDLTLRPLQVQGGNGVWNYSWSPGGSDTDSLSVNLFSSQTYCLTLSDGCETPPVTACTYVNAIPLPPLVLTADTMLGCEPFEVHFSLLDTTGAATTDWNFHDGLFLPNWPMTVQHTFPHHGLYDIYVNAHWPNGCSYDSTFTDLIEVVRVPVADFSFAPLPPDIFHHEVQFHELSDTTATSFFWDIAGLATSTEPDPSFDFPDDFGGLYPVQLIVQNYLGCPDTIVRTVNVNDAFLVYIPTAFSPDGDGINEVLTVEGNDIAKVEYHFLVFNRWGQKIFDSTDRTIGWDGTYKGKQVPVGVYPWMLRVQSAYTGENHDLRGNVMVIR